MTGTFSRQGRPIRRRFLSALALPTPGPRTTLIRAGGSLRQETGSGISGVTSSAANVVNRGCPVDERQEFARLLAGFRQGDPESAAELHRRYGPTIRAVVRR